ncbi:putative interaptin-like isoform X1 [Sesbania bispinosa]|nr:putative interaptin-like isoform X1 [Sesbania bispinosa]
MDLPPVIDDYIKESIDHCLGLPVSSRTLEFKLRASLESERQLREQHLSLLAKLKEKDDLIERARVEASLNAQAVKKFVEENQKLASECENLVAQCQRLERECALYDHDREALMEFGNEADERAKEAHMRAVELQQDLIMMEIELKKYKQENESVDSSSASTLAEESLLDSLLATVTSKDESSTYAFLDANSENEYCKKLLSTWNCLKQSTRRTLSLVAEVNSLENDKEHLRINLHRAEEEVKLLFDENSILDEKNKRLERKCKERNHPDSGGKLTSSTSAKSNKRKSSPKTTSSPMPRKIDFDDIDSSRQPLSPLRNNSPDCRMYKK